jgi:RND family efflux transporter MFP subunit
VAIDDKDVTHMRFATTGTTRLLLLATLLLGSALAAGCDQTQAASSGSTPPAVPVKLVRVEATEVLDTSEYVATLRSRRSITLQPQTDGQIRRIFVRSGDAVRAGDVIMQIDPSRQEASLRSQEATRVARQAELAYARQQHDRMAALFEDGIVSRQQVDQARSTLDAAQAQFDALEAQVREQAVQLRYYRITAPAEGVVGDIPVRQGDYVTPQTRLTTIDRNERLEAYVSVPIERAADLRLGMPMLVVDRAGATLATSRVFFVSPQVDDETQSVLVKALVDNPRGSLRAEQFARARLVWSTYEAPVVPTIAVTRLNGQPFIFVAEERDGTLVARQRPVRLGRISRNDYVVRKGIEPGERVVVSGIQKLRDGAPVTPDSRPSGG